uniref:Short-chain dehydrogenase/reductase 3 n=1 Tax=Timema shepardi TaxID=629360 RepID=A0A7R9ASP8_TIMSH|nr:unnamed protein product [Timema shepardi]
MDIPRPPPSLGSASCPPGWEPLLYGLTVVIYSDGQALPRLTVVIYSDGQALPHITVVIYSDGQALPRLAVVIYSDGQALPHLTVVIYSDGQALPRLAVVIYSDGQALPRLAFVIYSDGQALPHLTVAIYSDGQALPPVKAPDPITGTGHGIGKELALQFAMLGSTVVCWDINEDNNKKTVDELVHLGYKAHAYNCDVSSREQVFKIAREVKEKVGDVTVVVNNAGIMPCHPFMAHNSQEIQRIFDINVMAHFWMLEAFLPSMINKNHGHFVALSSMAGLMGIANLVPYCASKYAVRGLMEAMAEELREGNHQLDVKFTTICPFIVDTGLCKKPRTRYQDEIKTKIICIKHTIFCARLIFKLTFKESSRQLLKIQVKNIQKPNFGTKYYLKNIKTHLQVFVGIIFGSKVEFFFYFILISLKTSEISKFPQTSTNCEIGQRVRTKWLLNKIYNFKKINNPHVQLYKFHKTLSQKIINKSIHYTKIVYLTDSKIAMCRCCTATTASLYESSFLPNSFVEAISN